VSDDRTVQGDDLLRLLRDTVGLSDVAYAEPPVRLRRRFPSPRTTASGCPVRCHPWDTPLVVRLFPASSPADLPRWEAAVQAVVVRQGYPAAGVVFFADDARLLGRRFFIMERLPGRPMMGGIGVRELAGSGWRLFSRLADVTAEVQVSLHRLDADPLLAEFGDSVGIERWFARLEDQIDEGAGGLSEGLRWLVANRPTGPARAAICHGDLWGGNILTDDGRIAGVIDWTVATIAEPALDVGFTAMSLYLAPIEAPRAIQRAVAAFGRSLSKRYIRAYQHRTGARPVGDRLLRSVAVCE
jgi:aminoglycoside phosphotransferase (APT) family kinase protein